MSRSILSFSNTNPVRRLTFFTSNPELSQKLPHAQLSETMSETAIWTLEDGTIFGPIVRIIPPDYDFIDKFSPGQSVLYIMPDGRLPNNSSAPTFSPVRKVSVVLAAGETKLAAAVNRALVQSGRTAKVTLEPLSCGDVVFYIENEDGTRARFEIVIERKTPADFISSIKDHRLKDQTAVMLTNFSTPAAIIHFIEGDFMETPSGVNHKARMASLLNPMLREGTSAVIGHGLEATARFIVNIQMHLEHVPEEKLKRKGLLLAHTPNADIKKSDITAENKIIYQLRLVPGLGEVIASAIAAEYSSFELVEKEFEKFGKHALANVSIPSSSADKKSRSVGKAMSEKIYKFYEFDKHDQLESAKKKRKIIEDDEEEEVDEIIE